MMRPSLVGSLRRCMHTQARRPVSVRRYHHFTAALGASAVAGVYFTWRIASDNQRISLDSAGTQKQLPLASKTSETVTSALEPHTHAQDFDQPTEDEQTTSEGPSEEAESQGGAFNPVTGEINWDCPCLGGMAHGVCGPQFREAFSCFVFSEQEPKGIDCVEKFKGMQDCFRAHPDVYGEDIMNDDDDDDDSPPVEPSDDSPPSDASPDSAVSLTPPTPRTSHSDSGS